MAKITAVHVLVHAQHALQTVRVAVLCALDALHARIPESCVPGLYGPMPNACILVPVMHFPMHHTRFLHASTMPDSRECM